MVADTAQWKWKYFQITGKYVKTYIVFAIIWKNSNVNLFLGLPNFYNKCFMSSTKNKCLYINFVWFKLCDCRKGRRVACSTWRLCWPSPLQRDRSMRIFNLGFLHRWSINNVRYSTTRIGPEYRNTLHIILRWLSITGIPFPLDSAYG